MDKEQGLGIRPSGSEGPLVAGDISSVVVKTTKQINY